MSNRNIMSKKGDKIQELIQSSNNSNCVASELTECTCAGKPSQEDNDLVPPEGVQIAWELNGTR